MILNTCIFPFIADGELTKYGYHFIRASPLYEKSMSNFDFLIFHADPPIIAIFGEAKGSVSNPEEVVEQTKQRIKVVENFRDYITQKYLNAPADFEYVVGVEWPDAMELMKSVLRKGGEIIVWNSGMSFSPDSKKEELLELMVPGSHYEVASKTMTHKDRNLNRYLHKVKTSSACKDFFIESHRFAKLLMLNYVDRGKSDGIFTYEDLYELVKDTLDYLEDDAIKKETEEILRYAIQEIDFVEEVDNQPRGYRIVSKGKRADTREAELMNKWVDYEIKKEKNEEKKEKLNKLQDEFKGKRGLQKNIDEF